MALKVGDPAPPFALPLVPGEAPLRLSDYMGERPVVLLFFPLAFSSVCTDEITSVAKDIAAFHELEAEVVAISVDSPFVTRRFAAECRATFPILSDFNREAIRAYDVLEPDYYGLRDVARRSAFVIDRDGTILYSWEASDEARLPDLEAIKRAIREAR
jgi:glutaredoxin-dependent peroxiredoxin